MLDDNTLPSTNVIFASSISNSMLPMGGGIRFEKCYGHAWHWHGVALASMGPECGPLERSRGKVKTVSVLNILFKIPT